MLASVGVTSHELAPVVLAAGKKPAVLKNSSKSFVAFPGSKTACPTINICGNYFQLWGEST
jgi:hypothetical protein